MDAWKREEQLHKTMLIRRICLGVGAVAFLGLMIYGFYMHEATKKVEMVGQVVIEGKVLFAGWENVTYDTRWLTPILLGLFVGLFCGMFLITDLMYCRFYTHWKDQQGVTVYRGFLRNYVYVDGEEAGRIGPFCFSHVIEVWLKNNVRVTVSFGRVFWYIAHVSYSDDTPSVEI